MRNCDSIFSGGQDPGSEFASSVRVGHSYRLTFRQYLRIFKRARMQAIENDSRYYTAGRGRLLRRPGLAGGGRLAPTNGRVADERMTDDQPTEGNTVS